MRAHGDREGPRRSHARGEDRRHRLAAGGAGRTRRDRRLLDRGQPARHDLVPARRRHGQRRVGTVAVTRELTFPADPRRPAARTVSGTARDQDRPRPRPRRTLSSGARPRADWAVGAQPGGMAALRAAPEATVLVPGRTLLVHGDRPHVSGAAYVSNLSASRRSLAFANTEPDASQQWYLTADNAWAHWPIAPSLTPVKVAVIDSGIDASHPEFAGRVLGGISYVGGDWRTDTCGHGTFVAGRDRRQPVQQRRHRRARVQRRAARREGRRAGLQRLDRGRGRGDPLGRRQRRSRDQPLDRRDARPGRPRPRLVLAGRGVGGRVRVLEGRARGRGGRQRDRRRRRCPWPYADYPAALPHVLGVAALRENGSVPDFSNRDKQYVDIAAPGAAIFSTIPRNLVDASIGGCAGIAYSNCGPSEFQDGIGTSFAAPQVTAGRGAAARDRSEAEAVPARMAARALGDRREPRRRAAPSARPAATRSPGSARLDIAAAIDLLGDEHNLPTPDIMEPNDDAGCDGPPVRPAAHDHGDARLLGRPGRRLLDQARRRARSSSRGSARPRSRRPRSLLWKPGTVHVSGPASSLLPDRAALSSSVAGQQRLGYVAPVAGTYYLEVKDGGASRQPDRYQLSVAIRKLPATPS